MMAIEDRCSKAQNHWVESQSLVLTARVILFPYRLAGGHDDGTTYPDSR